MTHHDGATPVGPGRPLLVAHRSGNDPGSAERDATRADAIELDAHVDRGRVVVRHAKVIRPTSRLFERWYLLPPDTRVPGLDEILAAVPRETLLLIDLKCLTRRAARRIRGSIPEDRPIIVSARSWWVLAAFSDRAGTIRLRSCGRPVQLRVGRWLPGLGPWVGVAAHQRLLEPAVVESVLARTPHLFTWAVPSAARGRELADLGVSGLIVDDLTIDWDLALSRTEPAG